MTNAGKLVLADEVIFKEEKHEYWYRGKQLSGVTGRINKWLRIKMPEQFVGEMRDEGIHTHQAVQSWIDAGGRSVNSIHPGVLWLTGSIGDQCEHYPKEFFAEVLVSDFKQYASSVDIVVLNEVGQLELFDIKRNFKRVSVTWQLSIYKYFIEKYTPWKVGKMQCACIKDRDYYNIIPRSVEDVEGLLYAK